MTRRSHCHRRTATWALALFNRLAAAACQQKSEPQVSAVAERPQFANATRPPAHGPDHRERVSGVVKLDGYPLSGATLIFSPQESGSAAFGVTDVQGRYELRFSD